MKKSIMKNKQGFLRRLLLLGLCLVLLTGSALANEIVDISGEGYDCMYYKCTLPDGRIILTGWKGEVGNYMDSRARILCLNPDMTVSWEYIDPSEGHCGYTWTAVRKDGTLGTVFDNSPYQTPEEKKLVFFTPDGEIAGQEIALTEPGGLVNKVTASCVWRFEYPEAGGMIEELLDWEGRSILRYENEEAPFSGMEKVFEEEDGLVFAGRERGVNGCAKIFKIDFQGNTLWETVLPMTSPEMERSGVNDCMKTEDGGYLALVHESSRTNKDGVSDYISFSLVKFSPTGRILWTNREAFDRYQDKWFGNLVSYKGRVVVEMDDWHSESGKNVHSSFLWMDEEGNLLGTTELNVTPKDFPRMAEEKKPWSSGISALIPTEDGLWALMSYEGERKTHLKSMDTMDEYLVKVPEM